MSSSSSQINITLSTKEQWRRNPYAPHLRRTFPQIYTGTRSYINKVLSRVDLLVQMPEVSVSSADELHVAFQPRDVITSMRSSATDECTIYTSASGYELRPTLIANDGDEGAGKVYKIIFDVKKDAVAGDYIGLLGMGTYYQDFVLISIDKNYKTNRIIVYRDKEELHDIISVFRNVATLSDYSSDTIQFIDGSSITPEDLNWYYNILSRPLEKSTIVWEGVKCPISLLTSDEDDTHVTKVNRPYVHFSVNINQPWEEETLLFIETKLNVYSIHCRIPPNCTSIGMPAVSTDSGLIVKFVSTHNRFVKMEVLAIDYPFRTSLSTASFGTATQVDDDDAFSSFQTMELEPVPDAIIPLPEIDSLDDFFGNGIDLVPGDIIESCIRVHSKQWIEGEMEERPPALSTLTQTNELNFQGLKNFSLHHEKSHFRPQRILTDSKSIVVLRGTWQQPVTLKEKSNHRMHVAYIFNDRVYKHKLKFKTSNIHGEPLSYFFELPGPLHMHFILTDAGRAYALNSIVVDTLKTPPAVSEDDEEWAALA